MGMNTLSDRAAGTQQSAAIDTARDRARRGLKTVLTSYASVLLLIALIVAFWIATPNFMTVRNWQSLLVVQAVTGTMALASLMPLVVGEFDLSLGNLIGFLAMIGAYLAGKGEGATVVILAMVVAGLAVGILNGILTVTFKISSFIATLGVGIVLSGVTLGLSSGQVLFSGIPGILTTIGQTHVLGLAIAVWLTLALGIVLFYVLEHTPLGRWWYATGGSERVAFLAGVRTGLLKIVAFCGAGLFVAVAAMFELGQAGAANPGFGPELLLPAYAAAFLGVTTFRPGYYNVVGTFVAILLLAVGFNGLSLLGVPFWVQPIFNGAVLLLAVMSARAEARHVRVGG
jgi:ribose transport system permease protein